MNRILFILFVLVGGLAACNPVKEQAAEDYPLKAFSLVVGDRNYHAEIDQESREARIGAIKFGGEVLNVNYRLAQGYTITPDPASLLGNWPAEQVFTLSKEGEEIVNYTLRLSAYASKWPEAPGEVIFEDNFDQIEGLDETVWKYVASGSADWQKSKSGKPEHSFVKDGYLHLVTEKKNGQYLSGAVKTEYNKWFSNCHIEVCARLSDSEGLGQAIWLMPQAPYNTYLGWPEGGEIDMMEATYYDTNRFRSTLHSYYIHNIQPGSAAGWVNYVGESKGFIPGAFNVYGADLTDEAIVFYINGKQTARYENKHLEDEATVMQWPFSAPYYMIFSVTEALDDGTYDDQLPSEMLIDWIKITRI